MAPSSGHWSPAQKYLLLGILSSWIFVDVLVSAAAVGPRRERSSSKQKMEKFLAIN